MIDKVKKNGLKKVVVASTTPLSHGVGRRKSSVARVWMRRGNGSVTINGRDLKDYFDTAITKLDATRALRLVPTSDNYAIEVNVYGGGLVSQAGAVRLGIARALVKYEQELRTVLRQNGLLTSDARIKERKKPGQKAARRKFQFVKR